MCLSSYKLSLFLAFFDVGLTSTLLTLATLTNSSINDNESYSFLCYIFPKGLSKLMYLPLIRS
ncbi:uncharacterized protein DS421_2g33510 [Arachis hypogaea]|nr:uncharacterized protein DS421_2g33510 [Arachis hypogaea]